jgi:hypothetical protein
MSVGGSLFLFGHKIPPFCHANANANDQQMEYKNLANAKVTGSRWVARRPALSVMLGQSESECHVVRKEIPA